MNETRTDTDTALLQSLEFEPGCSFGHHPLSHNPPCDRPAAWAAVLRCCGYDLLYCQTHLALVEAIRRTVGGSCAVCLSTFSPGALVAVFSRIERIP